MISVAKPSTPPAAGLFGNQQAETCTDHACVPSETARAFARLFASSQGGEEQPAPPPRGAKPRLS